MVVSSAYISWDPWLVPFHTTNLTLKQERQVGPCIGPVIGGVLADKLGWRYVLVCLYTASDAITILADQFSGSYV